MRISELNSFIWKIYAKIEKDIKKDIKEKFNKDIKVLIKYYVAGDINLYYLFIESRVSQNNKNYFGFFVIDNKYKDKILNTGVYAPNWSINVPVEIKEYIENKYL